MFLTRHPYIVIFFVWIWLYIPFLGTRSIRSEEGHRAVASREMLRSGDWLFPTYLDEPYLKKPPGFYWLIMLASKVGGGVNEWTVRIPSALAMLFMAWVVCATVNRMNGIGWLSGLLILITPEFIVKGRFGEIDAVFSAQVLASFILLYLTYKHSSWVYSILGGLVLGWAICTKGPVALFFLLAAAILYSIFQKKPQILLRPQLILFFLLSLCPALFWIHTLTSHLEIRQLMNLWLDEIGSARYVNPRPGYLVELFRYPIGIFMGFLPGSLLVLKLLLYPETDQERNYRNLFLVAILPGLLLFWVHGQKVRYALPMAPLIIMAAGNVNVSFLEKWLITTKKLAILFFLIFSFGTANAIHNYIKADSPAIRYHGKLIDSTVPEGKPLYFFFDFPWYVETSYYMGEDLRELKDFSLLPEGESYVVLLSETVPSVPFPSEILLDNLSFMSRKPPLSLIKVHRN